LFNIQCILFDSCSSQTIQVEILTLFLFHINFENFGMKITTITILKDVLETPKSTPQKLKWTKPTTETCVRKASPKYILLKYRNSRKAREFKIKTKPA
jgi:hypothetical protein